MAQISSLSLTDLRRDLHAHPEAGWKEFRTTALIAEELDDRGFTLTFGPELVHPEDRLGVPSAAEIAAARDRAHAEDAPAQYLDRSGEISGLVATKAYGAGTGPTVGVRVDIDALERSEATDDDHRPAREGFASRHPNEMHACGHDGHTAIGIGIARELDANGEFDGTLALIFQPAEEGGRGGKPFSQTEPVADLEYLLALHLGLGNETGRVIAGYEKPLANTKLDVTFAGEPSHAGNAPNQGRNALQAAATAIQNLYAIPRHEAGATRINVGQVQSPNPQNVIAEEVRMRVEVRGETADLNDYMRETVERVLNHAAAMHGVSVTTGLYGETTSFTADAELVELVVNAANTCDGVSDVTDTETFGASEDASYLIQRVQDEGGLATYVGIGASNPYGHHTSRFDIDEDALTIGVAVLTETIRRL